MKRKVSIFLVIAISFYAFIYFWNKEEIDKQEHPTVHNAAAEPDDYLLEVQDYEASHRHKKSIQSIERAIQSMWKLENDVDDESFDRLEKSIRKLEIAHRKILRDSISQEELQSTLEYALSNLAFVELQVAEKYSKENQIHLTEAALKYAKLHIKNTLALHNSIHEDDSLFISSKTLLLEQIDSLFANENISKQEYDELLRKMIVEIDEVIEKIESK